mgnify:CR=1 FL=1
MLQFKAPKTCTPSQKPTPAYPLVQDLIDRMIVNFPENRPYNPHWIVSGKPLHRPLSI